MANRRRRQPAPPDRSHRHTANSMDQLAFTYMEMCKVESSTDSDSEISPRWSDTSTMGCVSSAPESGSYRRTLPLPHKPAGRPGCCSLFLDPYDGSSEDSDVSNVDVGVSNRPTRQAKGGGGGGCRFLGRSRRFLHHHHASLREAMKSGMRDPVAERQHLLDVQMKCGSDSELWVCELDVLSSHSDRDGCGDLKKTIPTDSTMHAQAMDVELDCQFDDSGLPDPTFSAIQMPGPETPVEGSTFHILDSSSERSPSPCNLRSLYKRKLGLLGAEMVELEQRKKQCVVSMEEEQEEGGSASEPCWSHLTTE